MSNNLTLSYKDKDRSIEFYADEDATAEQLFAKFIDFLLSIGYAEKSIVDVISDIYDNLDYTQYTRFTIKDWASTVEETFLFTN